jgi:hypothetical protein
MEKLNGFLYIPYLFLARFKHLSSYFDVLTVVVKYVMKVIIIRYSSGSRDFFG